MKFILIAIALTTILEVNAESCSFPNSEDQLTLSDCSDVVVSIKKAALSKIKFDVNGLSGGSIGALGCFWLNKKGVLRKTHCYDNGADEFSSGLARFIDGDGRFGYMNTDLRVVIKPQFTFAFPFQGTVAWACQGCESVVGKDTEHRSVEGGVWMTVDKKGKVTKCKKRFDHLSCEK